jgi:hypothetical protein
MVKRTNICKKDITVALELMCKQANLLDLALEYSAAVSSPAPTILFWRPYNAFKRTEKVNSGFSLLSFKPSR